MLPFPRIRLVRQLTALQFNHYSAFSYVRDSRSWNDFFVNEFSEGLIKEFKIKLADDCKIDTTLDVSNSQQRAIKMTMKVTENMIAPTTLVHGAAISLLADTAIGFGCYCYLQSPFTRFAINSMNIHFLKSARLGDTLLVEAKQIQNGNTLQIWDANVKCNESLLSTIRSTGVNLLPKNQPKRIGEFDMNKVYNIHEYS